MIVYKITNIVNNKIYIGQTIKSLKTRWSNHKSSSNCTYLKNAIKKYGESSFCIEELEVCESFEMLNEREKHYILLYDSTNPEKGYNLRSGGDSSIPNEETKKRMSIAQRKRGPMTDKQKVNMKGPKSEEAKQRLRTIWVGRKHSEESKQKMRDNKKLNPMSDEAKENLRQINLGKKLSEEQKQKISLAQTGKKRGPHSEETKRKIGQANSKKGKRNVEKII